MPDVTSQDSSPSPAPPSGSSSGLTKRQASFAANTLFIVVALSTMETTIANIALPTIAADLRASEADVIWVVNVFQIAMVATLLPFGALGEIIGHHRVSRNGILWFALGSLGCALAPDLPSLLIARIVQGLGASALVAVNGALIQFLFPPNRWGVAFGRNAFFVAVGVSLAPTVAAAILSVATWPWLFAVNVPVAAIAYLIALRTLPKMPRATHAFDIPAALLAGAGMGFLIFGVGSAAHHEPWFIVAAEIAAGVVFTTLLIRRQKGHPAPMLPTDLFRIPAFSLSAATGVCAFTMQGLAFVGLPFLFQDVMHRSTVETGILLTPWPVLVGLMAPIAGRLSDRYPVGILGSIGLATLAVGSVLLAVMDNDASTVDISWRLAICGIGYGFFQAPNVRALMTSGPAARSGGASGMVAMTRLVGQTLGAALAALCFLLAGSGGATLALWLAAGFSVVGCILSMTRLAVARPVR